MVEVRRRFQALFQVVLWGILLSAAVSPAQDAKTTLVEPPAPLLPQQVGDWIRLPDSALPSVPSDPKIETILTEAGLKRSEQGAFRVGNSGPIVTVTARQFVDATGAHAAYSFFQRPSSTYRGVGVGDETSLNGDRYLFRSVTSVVEASGARGATVDALLSGIQARLPKIGGPKAIPPILPTLLPEKGLERNSVRYALGPVSYEAMGGVFPGSLIGFGKAAEAVTARYSGRGELTMLLYPTPEIAGDRLRAIEEEVHRRGPSVGTVVMRRSGNLLLVTTGNWQLGEAKALVAGVKPRVEVTWNKEMPLQQPEFHSEVRKTYSLLTSIAIFCGFGALAAIVLGISLGAGRAAIRVLQGKPAATEPEFLRIDLSGRPAPIRMDGPGAGAKG